MTNEVRFVALDAGVMRKVQSFYKKEPLVAKITQLQDHYSLGDSNVLSARFGGYELDKEDAIALNVTLNSLLPKIRDELNKWGFVAVFDPNRRREAVTEEEREDLDYEEQLKRNVDNAIEKVGDIIPRASKLRKKLIGTTDKRSLSTTMMDLSRLSIVSINEGRFFLQIDPLTGSRTVVYARNKENGSVGQSTVVVDHDVYVYVESGGMPSDSGELSSKMMEIMRKRDLTLTAEDSMVLADQESSNPVIIFEQPVVPIKKVSGIATEMELLDNGASERAQRDFQMRLDGVNTERVNASRRSAFNSAVTGIRRQMSSDTLRRPTSRNSPGNGIVRIQERRTIIVPSGMRYVGAVPSTSTMNLEQVRHDYQTTVAMALGMPLSVLSGGSTSIGSANSGAGQSVSRGSAAMAATYLVSSIMSDRQRLSEAASSLWDLIYRETDNAMLSRVLADATIQSSRIHKANEEILKKHAKAVVDRELAVPSGDRSIMDPAHIASTTARLEEISNAVSKIAALKHRFVLEFSKMAHIPIETLQIMRELGAIDDETMTMSIAQSWGFPSHSTKKKRKR